MIIKKLLFILACIIYSFNLYAKTVEFDCPKVEVDNPYNIIKIGNNQGWENDNNNLARSVLNCNHYINSQGYLKCSYKASAHSSVNTYATKRMPPTNMVCKPKEVICGFICSEKRKKLSPKIKARKIKRKN